MSSILENLGKFIIEKRKESLVAPTQEILAELVGITRPTLIKIESGETSSSFELIFKILKALDTDFVEFENFLSSQSVENQIAAQIKNIDDRELILKKIMELQ